MTNYVVEKDWLYFFAFLCPYFKLGSISINSAYIFIMLPAFVYLFEKIKNARHDFVYIRRLIPNCKILYEIPIYSYDKEYTKLTEKLILFIDRIFRKRIHKFIDNILTLTNDKKIFGCNTLKISNGVDCSSIIMSNKVNFNRKKINIIAIAQFSFWHAYKRLIEGLSFSKEKNIYLYLIGNAPEFSKYKQIFSDYNLADNILKLIQDNDLRYYITNVGHAFIKQFSWD